MAVAAVRKFSLAEKERYLALAAEALAEAQQNEDVLCGMLFVCLCVVCSLFVGGYV